MILFPNYFGFSTINMALRGTSLGFSENKGWIKSIDPYGWLQCG